MAVTVPLNRFRRVSQPLNTSSQLIYQVPFDRASILLTVLGTNITNNIQTVTVSVSTINPLNGAPFS
jgi:hypothetical protein